MSEIHIYMYGLDAIRNNSWRKTSVAHIIGSKVKYAVTRMCALR